MAKRRTNPAKKTSSSDDRRALAAALKRRAYVLSELAIVGDRLENVERARQRRLAERDQLVLEALDHGVSMVEIARVVGTSRQALLKRLPARPVAGDQPAFDL